MKVMIKAKFLAFLILASICLVPSVSQAVVVQNKCITKIAELLKELPENLPKGNTIVVLDWDDTVSPWDDVLRTKLRKFEPREAGENGTLDIIRALQAKGFKTMVLTGRFGGHRLEEEPEKFDATVQNMLELVDQQEWMQHGPFKNTDAMEVKIPEALNRSREKGSKERSLYFLAKDHFVFAGGNQVKAKVMQQLIDMDAFIDKPDNIIFIDNDPKNTNDIADNFKNAPQNIYNYLYPGPKEKPCLGEQ